MRVLFSVSDWATHYATMIPVDCVPGRALCPVSGTAAPRAMIFQSLAELNLLTSSDMIVHHGGAGTTMTSICTGKPQLVVTFASEQATTANGSRRQGVGRHLRGHLATTATLAEEVRAVLAALH